ATQVSDRVTAAISDPATRSVRVSWFGGEPLMALRVIRQLSAQFVTAADKADVAYAATMATNGSLLSKRTLQLLVHECRLASMDVTIDGPEEIHNLRRAKRNGIGSFHHTIAVLAEAIHDHLVPELTVAIRVNVDLRSREHVPTLLYDLACFG